MTRILAGEYFPDQPIILNSGMAQVDGVYPIANGYAPVGSFSVFQNGTLAARCIGAGGYRYTGTAYLFAASTTNIYSYSASGYTSLVGSLTGSQAVGVRFCPYGSFMMATNGTDPIKKFDPTSPSTMTTLAAGAPTARFLAVVRGFLVAGYAGGSPLRVQWSDTGNPATWTTGGSSQAGQFDMPTGGDITGLVGGEYGLIFQERRIVRMTYTADSTVWQFDEIATDCGCVASKSLATFGKITFFWSDKGFMACDGTSVQSIGNEKVDRTFQSLLDRNYFDYMSAVVDPRNSLYIVALPSSNPTTTVFIYHYALERWTTAQITSELVFSALSLSATLESLDALYPSLDDMPISLDATGLRGGYPLLLLFDGMHRLGSLSGTAIQATFIDGAKELSQGRKTRLRSARPLTDAPAPVMSIIGRNTLADTPIETTYTSRSPNGVYRTRENWSYYQVKSVIPAGTVWSYFQGWDVDGFDGGMV